MTHLFGLHKAAKLVLFTTASSMLAYLLAYQLRFDFNLTNEVPQVTIWIGLCCLIVCRLVSYGIFNALNLVWRYFSITEFVPLFKAHVVSTLAFLAAVLLLRLPEFPRSIAIIESILSLFFNIATALSVRLLFEKGIYPLRQSRDRCRKDTIILGAGTSGHLLVKTLVTQSAASYHPVGVLDDSDRLVSSVVHGIPVLGPLSSLPRILERDPSIAVVLLAIPSLSIARTQELESDCMKHGIEFHRLQSFEDLAVQRIGSSFQELPIDQIFKRNVSTTYEEGLREAYCDKTILVTGGAGSIGSEAVRQLSLLTPKNIIVLDNSEYHLFQLEQELSVRTPASPVTYLLLDICDRKRMQFVIESFKPDIILHAAAYKHVPMSEQNPYSAFHTNVLGTKNIVELTLSNNVEKFILLSTDKAVEPANIMGCTKRIAELITQNLVGASKCSTKIGSVRFGNVINSRGSVIPLFTKQIATGGPITVTHPDVERYFMSIQEAVRLMLISGTLADSGEIFTLDMGKKVRIQDVANEMLRISGREDLSIEYTGLRPGEKLTEELQYPDEILQKTKFEKIQVIQGQLEHSELFMSKVEALIAEIHTLSNKELGIRIYEIIDL